MALWRGEVLPEQFDPKDLPTRNSAEQPVRRNGETVDPYGFSSDEDGSDKDGSDQNGSDQNGSAGYDADEDARSEGAENVEHMRNITPPESGPSAKIDPTDG